MGRPGRNERRRMPPRLCDAPRRWDLDRPPARATLRTASRTGRETSRDRPTVGDMIRRSPRALLAAAMLLTISAPVLAQDTSRVEFDGFGFSFDRALGESVNITTAPRQRVRSNQV